MKKLVYIILIPLLFLTTVQICLKYPMTREIFTDIEIHEGIKRDNQSENNNAVMEIEFKAGKPSKKIEILYNSGFVAYLDTKRVSFFAQDDGIVQIKNLSGEDICLDVNYNPDKLAVKIINKKISSGIQTLCTVNTAVHEKK